MVTDELFRLGWLANDLSSPRAVGCLRWLSYKATEYANDPKAGVFMLDTQAIFVETLLRGLGWETLDPYEVDRAKSGADPDIELWGKNPQGAAKGLAVVEVKPLVQRGEGWEHAPANGESPYEQVRRYAFKRLTGPECVTMEGSGPVLCGVVTNGEHWLVYDFDTSVQRLAPTQHQSVCNFNLSRPDGAALVRAIGRNELLKRFGLSAK